MIVIVKKLDLEILRSFDSEKMILFTAKDFTLSKINTFPMHVIVLEKQKFFSNIGAKIFKICVKGDFSCEKRIQEPGCMYSIYLKKLDSAMKKT